MSLPPSIPSYPYEVKKTLGDGTQIRSFSDANIQAAVDRAIAAHEAMNGSKKLVAVAHADGDGASLSLYAKLNDDWSLTAAAYRKWSGELKAEAEVVWSPF